MAEKAYKSRVVNSLHTKLRKLYSNIPLLPRPHLQEALNSSLRYKLLFICAPAGYGKTTTVAEWLCKRKEKTCWLTLDQLDNQPLHFWGTLSAAIQTLCPDAKQIPETNVRDVSDAMSLAHAIVETVSSLQEKFFLIFDDYHVIEQPFTHELVSCLLKIAPEVMHIIVLSRCELPASFATFFLQGQVKELRTKEIRFQAQEISALCRERNVIVTRENLQSLERATEGWPAGVHFALKDLGKANESEPVSDNAMDNNTYLAAYFETEVWGKFPEKVQEFMLKISVFDTFTAMACEAMTQEKNSAGMLELLQKNGAFLVSLDGGGGWFRYHYLYKAFLRRKLENTYKHQLIDLHRRAGEWLEQNNFFAEAINHALQAKDYDKAADLTIEYAKNALSRGHIHQLSVLFTVLPPTAIESNPLVGLAYTWTELLSGRFETYQKQLDKLVAFVCAGATTPDPLVEKIKNEIILIRALAASLKCDIDACLALNKEAHGNGGIFMNQAIDFNAGEASILARNLKYPLDKAMDFVLKMNAIWPGIGPPSGSWSITLGELLYERNELDNALTVLTEGIGMAERSQTMSPFVAGSITLARIARAKGKLDWAFEIIARAEEKIKQHKAIEWLRFFEAFRVWLWVDSNEILKISAWLAGYEALRRDSHSQRIEYEEIALARALQALGRFDEAERLLQHCLIRARSENRVPSLVVLLTLQATARHGAGDSGGALVSLNEALDIARRDGYLRSIIDEGAPVVVLLRQLPISPPVQEDSAFSAFGSTLLRLTVKHVAILKNAARACPPTLTVGRLTRREREMLRLLSTGQTNVAIAEQTGLTVNTVKSHIRSLYGKLGVCNRVQAISQARNRQLL